MSASANSIDAEDFPVLSASDAAWYQLVAHCETNLTASHVKRHTKVRARTSRNSREAV